MDFDFSDDQLALRDAVAKWVDKSYDVERRKAIVAAGGFDRATYDALADLGLTGIYVDEAYGGLGMGPVEAMVVLEELGRGIVCEPLAQAFVTSAVIQAHGSSEVKSAWLPKIASGEALMVLAQQERKARYRLDVCEAKAVKSGAGYALTAIKNMVPAGDQADAFVVPALLDGKLALFLVERTAQGVSTRGYPTQDEARAADLKLDGAPAQLITTEGLTALTHAADVGIACACGLMMVGNYQKGAIDFMVDVQFRQASREDLALAFIDPTSGRALHELAALPGVRHVEGFRDVPGVLANKRYGDESRLSMRGSGLDQSYHQRGVLLAQDGVPFADADGFSDFQKIDPLGARYIEVYKGGNALRFGGAQLGGAVNLITPNGKTAETPFDFRVEGGSYATWRARAAGAGRSGAFDYYASVDSYHADGYRQQEKSDTTRGTVNLGYSFGDDSEIRLIGYAADIRQGVPGALTLSDALNDPRYAGDGVSARYTGPGGARALATRSCDHLSKATLFTTTPALFKGDARGLYDRFETRFRLARHAVDGYAFAMLAAGGIDVVVDPDLKPYDIVALIPIIEKAGGVITTFTGGAPENGGDIVAAATPELHEAAMEALRR